VLRAVLDANIYVSAVIRPQGPPGQIVERFLRGSAFEIILSPPIVGEVLKALTYPTIRRHLRVDATAWFENIVVLADLFPGEHHLHGVSDDPDDDKYLAAAVEGRAHVVVTGDSDLLSVHEHAGVRVGSPRTFLQILLER
jgi:uncharacterized protein